MTKRAVRKRIFILLSHFGIKTLHYAKAAEVIFSNKFNHALKVGHRGTWDLKISLKNTVALVYFCLLI